MFPAITETKVLAGSLLFYVQNKPDCLVQISIGELDEARSARLPRDISDIPTFQYSNIPVKNELTDEKGCDIMQISKLRV